MEKVNPIRLLEVLPTSGMSCHKTWGLQGAQKEAAFHFSRLIFAFFPSTDLLLKCSQQRKLRIGNEPQQRLTPPLGQSKETSSLVQVSQRQSEGRRLRRCLAVHLTNPWRLRRLCPDLINVIHCQTSVRSVVLLTIWGQSYCYFNNRVLRREVSTGVWRRGVGSVGAVSEYSVWMEVLTLRDWSYTARALIWWRRFATVWNCNVPTGSCSNAWPQGGGVVLGVLCGLQEGGGLSTEPLETDLGRWCLGPRLLCALCILGYHDVESLDLVPPLPTLLWPSHHCDGLKGLEIMSPNPSLSCFCQIHGQSKAKAMNSGI